MRRAPKIADIPVPEHEYRVEIHTDWRYGKRAKFWQIQKFDKDSSDRYNEVVYRSVGKGGLAYTNIGMWWSIHRKLKKMRVGYKTTYYGLDKNIIE